MSSPINLNDFMIAANSASIFYNFLPRLLAAIVIFIIGLILANIFKKIVVKLLNSINLSKLTQKTAFEDFLQKAEIKTQIEDIIGGLLKWMVILVFTVTSVNVLGIPTISDVLNGIIAYIPRIISATVVLASGILLAGVLEGVVKGSVGQIDVKLSRLLGKIASYVMLIFAVMAAINELGIAKEFINILFIGFVSMLSLGFGLAIGLGAKDLVSQTLTDWHKQLKKEINQKDKEK